MLPPMPVEYRYDKIKTDFAKFFRDRKLYRVLFGGKSKMIQLSYFT